MLIRKLETKYIKLGAFGFFKLKLGAVYTVGYYSVISNKQVKFFVGSFLGTTGFGVNKRILLVRTVGDVTIKFYCYVFWNNIVSITRR